MSSTPQERALRASAAAADVARVRRFRKYLREMRADGLSVIVERDGTALTEFLPEPVDERKELATTQPRRR